MKTASPVVYVGYTVVILWFSVILRSYPAVYGGLRWTSVIVRRSFEHVENLDGYKTESARVTLRYSSVTRPLLVRFSSVSVR